MVKYSYRLKKIANLANGNGKILDIGFSLLPNPYLKNAIGIDISLPKKKPENYEKMIKASIYKLPFKNNSVDVAVLSGIIEHLENPLSALKEVNRVLKENSLILIETPNPYFFPLIISDLIMNLRYYFYDTHISLFPRRIMLKLLWHSGFELEKIKGCGMNLNENLAIPLPQQLSQDLIYVARKKASKNRYYEKVKKLRDENYEDIK